jgi:hypothetical protein
VVGDALELARAGLVVEHRLAREADLVGGGRVPEDRPEHARDHVPEAVDVLVAVDDVFRQVVVVLDECLDGVVEHRQRDQPHPGDGVVDRQLRGVEQVLEDDVVGRLLDDLQADQSLGGITDRPTLFGRDSRGLEPDDVEAADVHRHHGPCQLVGLVHPADVEGPFDAVVLAARRQQQKVLLVVELDDAPRADPVLGRPLLGERDGVRRPARDLHLACLHVNHYQSPPNINLAKNIY